MKRHEIILICIFILFGCAEGKKQIGEQLNNESFV